MANVKPKAWRQISSECVADCKVFKVLKNRFRHPDGREGDFFINVSADWVQVAPIIGGDSVLLVNQYRFGVDKFSWEFPGGIMEKGETPEEAAARELLEETGYKGQIKLIGGFSPNPAIQNNRAFFTVAKNCEKLAETHWDEHEELESKIVKISDLDDMVFSGQIHHSIAINGVYLLQKYLSKNATIQG